MYTRSSISKDTWTLILPDFMTVIRLTTVQIRQEAWKKTEEAVRALGIYPSMLPRAPT
jgi:hypothetical protein